MKYEAILQNSSDFSERKMCRVLGLKETNYYRWKHYREKRLLKQAKETVIVQAVRKIFLESRQLYGYRKMVRALACQGIIISEYKVRRIMRNLGLYPETIKKYRPGRSNTVRQPYAANELKQDFFSRKPGKVLAGDITYIKTNQGWVYLAVVMDLYNREVIGYSVSKNIDGELVKRALGNAIAKRGSLVGAVFHSDRGTQYCSESFRRMLEISGIRQSMSRGGCPYDNACSESFFATAKKECIYLKKYDSIEEVKRDIFEYVELFYNRKRMHSYLGYMSPVDYRLKYTA